MHKAHTHMQIIKENVCLVIPYVEDRQHIVKVGILMNIIMVMQMHKRQTAIDITRYK